MKRVRKHYIKQDKMNKQSDIDNAANEPLVKSVRKYFPTVEIIDVIKYKNIANKNNKLNKVINMLKNLGNIGQMMKQAQVMQEKVKEMQAGLSDVEVIGQSAAGMVSVVITGNREVKNLEIDESFIHASEKEILEDLIVAALNDGLGKVDIMMRERNKGNDGRHRITRRNEFAILMSFYRHYHAINLNLLK